jgi:hypothetical protein
MALCRHHLLFTSYVVRFTSVLVIDSLRQRSVSEGFVRYEKNVNETYTTCSVGRVVVGICLEVAFIWIARVCVAEYILGVDCDAYS